MRSFLRAMTRNPLDHTGDRPGLSPRLIAFVVAVVLAVAGLGLWAQWYVLTERETDLRRALATQGLNPAQIKWIGWCKGEGPRFAWRAATAQGQACAGPRATDIVYGPGPRPEPQAGSIAGS